MQDFFLTPAHVTALTRDFTSASVELRQKGGGTVIDVVFPPHAEKPVMQAEIAVTDDTVRINELTFGRAANISAFARDGMRKAMEHNVLQFADLRQAELPDKPMRLTATVGWGNVVPMIASGFAPSQSRWEDICVQVRDKVEAMQSTIAYHRTLDTEARPISSLEKELAKTVAFLDTHTDRQHAPKAVEDFPMFRTVLAQLPTIDLELPLNSHAQRKAYARETKMAVGQRAEMDKAVTCVLGFDPTVSR